MYVTGGLAMGRISSSVTANVTQTGAPPNTDVTQFTGSASTTRLGWTMGAGFEHAFTDRLSAKVEYLHFDLGDITYAVNGTVLSINPPNGNGTVPLMWYARSSFSGDIVRLGVNYKLSP